MDHQYRLPASCRLGIFPGTLDTEKLTCPHPKPRSRSWLSPAGCHNETDGTENTLHDVLLVYRQVSLQFDENGGIIIPENEPLVHTVSCDEKPGIQAVATTGAGLRPTTETGCVYRDAEYKRLGTLSLLAGIDLLTGMAIPVVSETHKSCDFITPKKNWMKHIPRVTLYA